MARTQYLEMSDLEKPNDSLPRDVATSLVNVMFDKDIRDPAGIAGFIDDLASNGVEALKSRGFITAADMHQALKRTMHMRRLEILTRLQWEAARHDREIKAIMQYFDY